MSSKIVSDWRWIRRGWRYGANIRKEGEGLLIEVAYTSTAALCPRCGRVTNKVHDRRAQPKRDVPLRGQRVTLLLQRRRFRCLWCAGRKGQPHTFSEEDPTCGSGPKGRGRRSTCRLREEIAEQLPHQTVKRVAEVYAVGERF